MKKRFILGLSFSAIFTVSLLAVSVSVKNENIKKAEGYSAASLPTTIDLNDTSAANIRSYYSSLNNLSQSERQGPNLLKNLKTILKNGQKYFSYENGENIWKMYEITDRDWVKSPASAITNGTYNANTKKITGYTYNTTDPYIRAIYINRNVDNKTTAWSDHQQTQWGINREHLWPKAEGFDSKGAGGARGDPFHLVAANGYANNIHSNLYYGYVNKSSSYTDCGSKYSNLSGNIKGVSKTLGGSTDVFEPQDSDKGDIARSIFYMVARYNYLSGSDSDGINANNPNLTLTQSLSDWSSSGYTSSTSKSGKLGILTDLLAWHHADPVDEIEIHRNNLLYTNFTNNRNPFVDFPEWADFIWGTATYSGSTYQSYNSTPTGYAKPSSDTLNGYNSGSTDPVVNYVTVSPSSVTIDLTGTKTRQLTATVNVSHGAAQTVTWTSSNTSVATVSSSGLVTGKAAGSATITATSTADSSKSDVCTVTVLSGTISVTGVSLNSNSESLNVGGSVTLSATVSPNNATNKNVSWATSDDTVAEVEDGVVTAVGAGTATITATTDDGDFTDECIITVNSGSSEDHTQPGSATISEGYASGWTQSGSFKNDYQDGSVGFTATGAKLYKFDIFSGDASVYMTDLKVTINAKINGTPTTANSYSVEAISSSGNNIISKASDQKTGSSIFSSSSYGEVDFEMNSGLSGTTGIRVTYVTKGGGNWAVKGISWVATYSVPSGPTVTGISLDTSNVNKNFEIGDAFSYEGLVVTAEYDDESSAIVTPDSVSTPDMDSEGFRVVTVTYEEKEASYEIYVGVPAGTYSLTSGSPYINGIAYKMYITKSNKNYYFTGAMNGDYGETSEQIANAIDVYFEQNGSGQNIRMSSNKYIYITRSGGKTYFKCDATEAPSTPWIYNLEYSELTYTYNNVAYTTGSKGTHQTLGGYTIEYPDYKIKFMATDSNASLAFANVCNNNISCSSQGTSAPTFNGFYWSLSDVSASSFENIYNNLDDDSKYALYSSSAIANGTEIERFISRYDYIVGKYGSSTYNDFIHRNPSPIGNGALTDVVTKLDSSNTTIIVTCGVIGGLLALGAYVLIKKKKED